MTVAFSPRVLLKLIPQLYPPEIDEQVKLLATKFPEGGGVVVVVVVLEVDVVVVEVVDEEVVVLEVVVVVVVGGMLSHMHPL